MLLMLEKARYVIRHEGFPTFLRRGLLFIKQSIYFSRKYYLYVGKVEELPRKADSPKAENVVVRIISSNYEFEQLSEEGFIFKPWNPEYRIRLDKGSQSFCAFSNRQLVHVSWCARTLEGMKSFGEPPYKVDFADNEVVSGDYWTHPGYRGMNLAHYVTRMRVQYLRENGVVTTRSAVPLDNLASQRVIRPGGPKLRAVGQ